MVRGTVPLSEHKPRVLVADDDAETQKILSDWLTYQDYEVVVAADGEKALALAAAQSLDLALVDVVMPEPGGMALTRRLKELWPEIEVIIITAFGCPEDAAEAVRGGAFHYLTKPLSLKRLGEVVNEAWALRQARAQVQVGELIVDLRTGRGMLRGEVMALTPLEERLLACLARRQGQVVSYDELWREGWGYDSPLDKAVIQRAMSRLREKFSRERIVCVRGHGYRLG